MGEKVGGKRWVEKRGWKWKGEFEWVELAFTWLSATRQRSWEERLAAATRTHPAHACRATTLDPSACMGTRVSESGGLSYYTDSKMSPYSINSSAFMQWSLNSFACDGCAAPPLINSSATIFYKCMYVCVCVRQRELESACACVREKEREICVAIRTFAKSSDLGRVRWLDLLCVLTARCSVRKINVI